MLNSRRRTEVVYGHRTEGHVWDAAEVTETRAKGYVSCRPMWVTWEWVGLIMYGCESWTIKKAEHQRIHAFELWCWRRLLRVPWTARKSNQSILEKINAEYSLEGLMLKLKLQYFGHLMWRTDSLAKTLMDAGKGWRQKEKGATKDKIVGWHH